MINFIEKAASMPTYYVIMLALAVSIIIFLLMFSLWKKFDKQSSFDYFSSNSYKNISFLLKHNGSEKNPCLLTNIESIPLDKYFPINKWKEF